MTLPSGDWNKSIYKINNGRYQFPLRHHSESLDSAVKAGDDFGFQTFLRVPDETDITEFQSEQQSNDQPLLDQLENINY